MQLAEIPQREGSGPVIVYGKKTPPLSTTPFWAGSPPQSLDLDLFARGQIKNHKPIGLNSLTVLEARSTSKCQQGWSLPRAVKENLLHSSLPGSDGCWRPWPFCGFRKHHPHLRVHHHMVFSLCVCVCLQISPSAKDTSHIGLVATLLQ